MDVKALSDDGLLRLIAALANKPQAAPQQSAGQMAAEGVGPMQAGLIGAGKATDDLVQGAKQLYYRATDNQPELDALRAQQAEASRLYAPLKEQHSVMTGLGESVPAIGSMIGTGGSAFLPMALAKAAAASGLTEGAKYGTDQERVQRGLVGAAEGAGGTLLGYGLGKMITPAAKSVAGASQEAMDAAQRLGVKLTPGQITGSKPLLRTEQMLAQRPGSAGVFAGFAGDNTTAINRAAASAMGESADAITPDVFAAARSRIGAQFDRIMNGRDVTLGPDFLNALVDVEAQHNQMLPSLRNAIVPKVLDDALNLAAAGKISGQTLQKTRSRLTQAADDAFRSGNSSLGQSLKGIRSALDDAAGQSLTKTEQLAWQQARAEWKAMRTLEKGNVVQDGTVSPQLLKTAVRINDPVSYKTGQTTGPLTDIARYAEGVRPLPDSGTAGNLAALKGSDTLFGFLKNLGGIPLRYGAAKGLLSDPGRAYLGNGILSDEAMKRLMQSGGLLGVANGQ